MGAIGGAIIGGITVGVIFAFLEANEVARLQWHGGVVQDEGYVIMRNAIIGAVIGGVACGVAGWGTDLARKKS
jgi:hypothetical protein